jgi:hypothetical protein
MVYLRQIGNVDEAFAVDQRPGERVIGAAVSLPKLLCERPRIRVCRRCAEDLACAQHQRPMGDAAKVMRLFQYCVEHRGEVAGRGVDDLQYFGGCRLLLQCLARLGQEPRVLHRNDRLRRETPQQRYLIVREWADFLAKSPKITDSDVVFTQSDPNRTPRSAQFDHGFAPGAAKMRRLGGKVRHRNDFLTGPQPARIRPGRNWHRSAEALRHFRRKALLRQRSVVVVTFVDAKSAECGIAQIQSLPEYRVEHRLDVAGRGIYDLQHLGHRGLLGSCLVALGGAFRKLSLEFGDDLLRIG